MITPSECDRDVDAEPATPDHARGPDHNAVAAQTSAPASPQSGGGGFGSRLDRLLQAAEQEALQIHDSAERRAAALLTEAPAEIARHEQERHREWHKRQTALAAAEQRSTLETTAAHERAAQLLAATESEAQRIRGRALLRAREISNAADQDIEQRQREAAAEFERLAQLRDGTRAEIVRLLRTLDGIREALAYDLDPELALSPTRSSAPAPGRAEQRPAATAGSSAPPAAIGRRPGDLHRTRLSGLFVADTAGSTNTPDSPGPGERQRPAGDRT